jgi:hypothetical protein
MARNLVLTVVFWCSWFPTFSQEKDLEDFGVVLDFSGTRAIFHDSWLTPKINGQVVPLDSSEFERSRAIVLKALNKYPEEVVRKHLTKICVVKYLEFFGQEYGGTNSTSTIYISNQGAASGYTDFWIEQAFHSEFSSILFRNFSFLFDQTKWTDNNVDVHYGTSGTDALKNGKASKKFDFDLNRRGILCEYGMASLEEDFNTFAENLFLSSTGFWEIGKLQKRIRKKVNQVVQFYNLIDNRFTEDYFRQVSAR